MKREVRKTETFDWHSLPGLREATIEALENRQPVYFCESVNISAELGETARLTDFYEEWVREVDPSIIPNLPERLLGRLYSLDDAELTREQRQSKALHRHNDWAGETIAETQRRLSGESESLSELRRQLAESLEAQRRSDDMASLAAARATHDELASDKFTAPQRFFVSRVDYSRRIRDLRERIARLEGV